MNILFKKYAAKGELLDLDGFRAAFRGLWPKCNRRFLKLETLLSYSEPDNLSWIAFAAGNKDLARDLLKEGLSRSLPFYERVRTFGIDSHRVRPVAWPLTPYLEWEFLSYEISIRNGQRVSLYPAEAHAAADDISDFVLFDDYACMIHRYSERGEHEGGVLLDEPTVIEELADIHHHLSGLALPFHEAVDYGADQRWHRRTSSDEI